MSCLNRIKHGVCRNISLRSLVCRPDSVQEKGLLIRQQRWKSCSTWPSSPFFPVRKEKNIAIAFSTASSLTDQNTVADDLNVKAQAHPNGHEVDHENHDSNNNSEIISIQYPRTDSFSEEEKHYLTDALGISNFEFKNPENQLNLNQRKRKTSTLRRKRPTPPNNVHMLNIDPPSQFNPQYSHSHSPFIEAQQRQNPYPQSQSFPSNYQNEYEYEYNHHLPPRSMAYMQNNNNNNNLHLDEGIKTRIRVKSLHAARTIDLVSIISKAFGGNGNLPKPVRYRFGKSSVIVQLPPILPNSSTPTPTLQSSSVPPFQPETEPYNPMQATGYYHLKDDETIRVGDINSTQNHVKSHSHNEEFPNNHNPDRLRLDDDRMRYVVAFRFGSVVFFNVAPTEAQAILQEIKKHSVDPVATGFEQKEHFEVAICPGLNLNPHQYQDQHQDTKSLVNGDYAIVQQLDMNNVAVISTIMAQTVAMDSYNNTVDELLATFAKINATVKSEGKFTDMERETLLRVVAMNNAIFIDMVSKLGVMDRSDTAWNFSQYETVFEEMKNEFEIYNRFENIEFKLNLIQENAKFFLEVLQGQKSNTLEWVIIVLIAFECVLMCLDMSGLGSALCETLPFELGFPGSSDPSAGGSDIVLEPTSSTTSKSG